MKYVVLVLAILLSGCSTIEPYATQLVEESQKYQEGRLDLGEHLTCSSDVPTLIKRYKTKEQVKRWFNFCWPEYEYLFEDQT